MDDSLEDISGARQPAPHVERAAHRDSETPNRLPRCVSLLISFAALSTVTGYQVARLEMFRTTATPASALVHAPALMHTSNPRATDIEIEAISHLAPQQQADRLLELAIHSPDQSVDLIHKNLDPCCA